MKNPNEITKTIAARTHVQRRDSKSSIHKDNKEEDGERNDEDVTVDESIPANNDELKEVDHAGKSETEVNPFRNNLSHERTLTQSFFFF